MFFSHWVKEFFPAVLRGCAVEGGGSHCPSGFISNIFTELIAFYSENALLCLTIRALIANAILF